MWSFFEKPLPVGEDAPDFDALDEAGNPVRLSALRGRPVLLVFYPGDDTPGCRKQLCELRDSWGLLSSRGAAVFGVNPQNAGSHQRFTGKYGFPFPILVDSGQRIAKLYRSSGLMVKRTVVLIGPDGKILFAERGMPSPERVLQALPGSADPRAAAAPN